MSPRTLSCGVVFLSVSLCGCQGGAVGVGMSPQAPSLSDPVSVTLGFATGVAPFVGTASNGPAFDVVVSSASGCDVDAAMFRLIDGTSLGGPMVTVPAATLGATHIAAGTSRTFRVRPPFVLNGRPNAVAVDVSCVDGHGVRHIGTDQRPWQ